MAGISRQIGWSQESNLLYYILQQLTKLTSVIFNLKPKYKVFTALLTQSGGDNPAAVPDGAVTKGVTYQILDASNGDFSNIGAPNNNTGTYFVATNNEIPNSYGDAILGWNEGAPVVTVLENTIGNVWFSYNSVGSYSANSNGLFIGNIYSPQNKNVFFNDSYETDYRIKNIGAIDNNAIELLLYNLSNDYSDNALHNTPIEIRVYY
jgi:hypothetical protein